MALGLSDETAILLANGQGLGHAPAEVGGAVPAVKDRRDGDEGAGSSAAGEGIRSGSAEGGCSESSGRQGVQDAASDPAYWGGGGGGGSGKQQHKRSPDPAPDPEPDPALDPDYWDDPPAAVNGQRAALPKTKPPAPKREKDAPARDGRSSSSDGNTESGSSSDGGGGGMGLFDEDAAEQWAAPVPVARRPAPALRPGGKSSKGAHHTQEPHVLLSVPLCMLACQGP